MKLSRKVAAALASQKSVLRRLRAEVGRLQKERGAMLAALCNLSISVDVELDPEAAEERDRDVRARTNHEQKLWGAREAAENVIRQAAQATNGNGRRRKRLRQKGG